MKQVYSWPPSSRTPAAMTLAWGAKVRGRWRLPGPIFFQAAEGQGGFLGVSHLLHTRRPSHLRALLYKLGNVEGEVLNCLVYLNVMLPSCSRPDAVVIFLQPS